MHSYRYAYCAARGLLRMPHDVECRGVSLYIAVPGDQRRVKMPIANLNLTRFPNMEGVAEGYVAIKGGQRVYVPAFSISATEISLDLLRIFSISEGRYKADGICQSWCKADAFAAWLSEQAEIGCRLPTVLELARTNRELKVLDPKVHVWCEDYSL